MFFSSVAELTTIAQNAQTILVNLSDGTPVGDEIFHLADFAKTLRAQIISPDETNKIKIEQTREVINLCSTKQTSSRSFIFTSADTMTRESANCLLKLLEEPLENYHFILLTTNLGAILPTIRSRAVSYAPRQLNPLEQPPVASDEILALAKRILVAKPADIPEIADVLSKQKPDVRRNYTLKTLETAIELSYKSYFKTKNPAFNSKLPNLLAAHSGISKNGNLKLQFIANLI